MKDYPFFKLYIAHFQRDIIGKSYEQIGEYIVSAVNSWMDGEVDEMPSWMSDEYHKLTEKSQKLAENGRKGGQAKAKQLLANAKQILPIGKQRREEKSRVDKIRIDKSINTKTTPISPRGFEEFWEAYPKKVGKGEAVKKWAKLKPPLEKVLSTLEWQKASDQWSKDNGQFIPNPTTWINQCRWEDEKPNDMSQVSTMQAQYERLYGNTQEALSYER